MAGLLPRVAASLVARSGAWRVAFLSTAVRSMGASGANGDDDGKRADDGGGRPRVSRYEERRQQRERELSSMAGSSPRREHPEAEAEEDDVEKGSQQDRGRHDRRALTPLSRRDEIFYSQKMTRLGKHGDVQGAIDLLEDMASYSLRPNREVMNLLIKICGEHGRGNQALHLFNRMKQRGIVPDERSYTSLLAAVVSSSFANDVVLEHVQKARLMLGKEGIPLNVILYNGIIKGYARARRLDLALSTFEEMRLAGVDPDTVTYGTMISALGVSRDGKGALSLFEEAKRSIHVTVDAQLVCAVLVACKNSLRGADAAKGLDIYREYFTSIDGQPALFKPDIFPYTHALLLALKCGDATVAKQLLADITHDASVQLDAFILRPMLQCASLLRDKPMAESLWAFAREHQLANLYVTETMIQTLMRLGDFAQALDLFDDVINRHRPPYSMALLRDALHCARALGKVRKAEHVSAMMRDREVFDEQARRQQEQSRDHEVLLTRRQNDEGELVEHRRPPRFQNDDFSRFGRTRGAGGLVVAPRRLPRASSSPLGPGRRREPEPLQIRYDAPTGSARR